MPNKKSAKKELRKNLKRKTANQKQMAGLRKLIKNNLGQIKDQDKKVKNDFKLTVKAIDKAAKRGIIKRNTAARKKSQLQRKLNALK
ncbi:MAG: 30S ribosomal protein S20 [Candidatus Falkowbacteria bacterium]|nr:30S ribosomal protein S20 [Candidatus Falkowbacteria bacterium]